MNRQNLPFPQWRRKIISVCRQELLFIATSCLQLQVVKELKYRKSLDPDNLERYDPKGASTETQFFLYYSSQGKSARASVPGLLLFPIWRATDLLVGLSLLCYFSPTKVLKSSLFFQIHLLPVCATYYWQLGLGSDCHNPLKSINGSLLPVKILASSNLVPQDLASYYSKSHAAGYIK